MVADVGTNFLHRLLHRRPRLPGPSPASTKPSPGPNRGVASEVQKSTSVNLIQPINFVLCH